MSEFKFRPMRVMALVMVLESGAFKQTNGRLKKYSKGARHCCLGVACEMYATEVGGGWKNDSFGKQEFEAFEPFSVVPRGDDYNKGVDVTDTNGTMLPKPVARWIGLDGDAQSQLAEMNDNGYSFKLIARYLRERVAEHKRTKTYPVFNEPSFDKHGKDQTN